MAATTSHMGPELRPLDTVPEAGGGGLGALEADAGKAADAPRSDPAVDGLLPHTPPVDDLPYEPATISLETADRPLEVLTSATARELLVTLYEDPAPASVVAERVATSLQNTTHHLHRLRSADLVHVVDTWYSAKGREMKVYAPTKRPLVLVAGRPGDVRTVRDAVDGGGDGIVPTG